MNVAKSLGAFDSRNFKEKFLVLYPARNPGSIIPSDYCVNCSNKGNPNYPRFLKKISRGNYKFVDLDQSVDLEEGSAVMNVQPAIASPAKQNRRVPPRKKASQRFIPDPDCGLLMDEKLAEKAIRDYNSDRVVLQ